VGVAYVYVAVESAARSNTGLSVLYAGYAFANIGAWMLAA
jgi:hypothetical protein